MVHQRIEKDAWTFPVGKHHWHSCGHSTINMADTTCNYTEHRWNNKRA
jgi:hypothetical protein